MSPANKAPGRSVGKHSKTPDSADVIAIDGPGGSGKGTVSLAIADRLGWHYLESGAVYRVIGHLAQQKHIGFDDVRRLVGLAENLHLEFKHGAVWINGREAGDVIRTEEAGKHASLVAAIPEVRQILLHWQRNQARAPGLVADGRDMGTVVFPAAICKFFITASVEVRAQRRFRQLRNKGFDVNMPQLVKDISERDARDQNRAVSPLRPADDALLVDTTDLTTDEVVSQVMHQFRITGNRIPEKR